MATANSNAQREPSMEEILASIRRIIEDSDTGRKQPGEAVGTHLDAQQHGIGRTGEVEAFRAELRTDAEPPKPLSLAGVEAQLATEPAPAMPAAETARPPLRLADVAARVTEEPEFTSAPAQAEEPEPIAIAEADVAPGVSEAAVSEAAVIAPDTGHDDDAEAADEDAAFADAIDLEPEFLIRSMDAERLQPAEAAPARPALISQQTSRQVAAAFEELSEAFASRSRKTFDEMAEEMLRPMLQDWLDNNLPTLVERLVREEIERVARGA